MPISMMQMLKSGTGWDSIKNVTIDGEPAVRSRLRLRPVHMGMRLSSSLGTVKSSDIGRDLVVDVYEDGSIIDVISSASKRTGAKEGSSKVTGKNLEYLIKQASAWAANNNYDAVLDPILDRVGFTTGGDKGFWLGEVLGYISKISEQLPQKTYARIDRLIEEAISEETRNRKPSWKRAEAKESKHGRYRIEWNGTIVAYANTKAEAEQEALDAFETKGDSGTPDVAIMKGNKYVGGAGYKVSSGTPSIEWVGKRGGAREGRGPLVLNSSTRSKFVDALLSDEIRSDEAVSLLKTMEGLAGQSGLKAEHAALTALGYAGASVQDGDTALIYVAPGVWDQYEAANARKIIAFLPGADTYLGTPKSIFALVDKIRRENGAD